MTRPADVAALKRLFDDEEACEIVRRAAERDGESGSGASMDFGLFVVDETRKAEQRRREAKRKPEPCKPWCGTYHPLQGGGMGTTWCTKRCRDAAERATKRTTPPRGPNETCP